MPPSCHSNKWSCRIKNAQGNYLDIESKFQFVGKAPLPCFPARLCQKLASFNGVCGQLSAQRSDSCLRFITDEGYALRPMGVSLRVSTLQARSEPDLPSPGVS